MFNMVAINLPDAHGNYAHHCHMQKCPNEGRYQIYSAIEDSGLPDWEGQAICSRAPAVRPHPPSGWPEGSVDGYPQVPARLHGHPGLAAREGVTEPSLGNIDHRDRRHVAVVVTSDGRRVPVPVDSGLVDVSLLLRNLLLGLESLLGLITGSRRENGGTRRNGHR